MKRFGILFLAVLGAFFVLAACAVPITPPTLSPTTAVPSKNLTLRVGFTSQPDFGDIPTLLAFDILKEKGYIIEPSYYTSADLAVAALERNEANFANGATRSYWAGISKGVNARVIMEQVANEWTVLSVPAIESCQDLGGMRYGTNTTGGVARLMTQVYVRDNCPDVEMVEVSIPSSENRAAAMLAGEIDAAGLELADSTRVMAQAPDRFHIFLNFSEALPDLKTTAVHVNQEFAEQNPEAVRDYVRALLTVHRNIQADPTLMENQAVTRLQIEPATAKSLVAAYNALGAWDPNGGLDDAGVQYTIDFFTDAGALDEGLTVEKVADLSYLNSVLSEIGRQE